MEDVNKVKTIGRQRLTQNSSSYLMRCIVLIRGLFESADDYEQNEIKLNQDFNHLKEQHNTQVNKISDMEKQLSGEDEKGKTETENQELWSTVTKKYEEMKSIRESNDQLHKALQKA